MRRRRQTAAARALLCVAVAVAAVAAGGALAGPSAGSRIKGALAPKKPDMAEVADEVVRRKAEAETTPREVRTTFAGSEYVVKGKDPITEEVLEAYGTLSLAAAHMAYEPLTHFRSDDRSIAWCPAVPLVTYFHDQKWQEKSTKGGNYNILTNDKMGVAVVAFRGTDGLWDVAHDINPSRLNFMLPPNLESEGEGAPHRKCGLVHRGFYNQFTAIKDSLLARMAAWVMFDLESATRGHAPMYQTILFVGHSLGGALATLASAYVANRFPTLGERITTITFGAPNIGNAAFVECFDSLIKHSARVEAEKDPIPHLPRLESVGKTKVVVPCKLGFTLKLHKCHLMDQYYKAMQKYRDSKHDVCFQRKEYKNRQLHYKLENAQ